MAMGTIQTNSICDCFHIISGSDKEMLIVVKLTKTASLANLPKLFEIGENYAEHYTSTKAFT